MNNDQFVLSGIVSILNDQIEYMNKKYKGCICIDDDGDEFEILGLLLRDNVPTVHGLGVKKTYTIIDDLSRFVITERRAE